MKRTFIAIATVLILAAAAGAQVLYGSLTGTITDSTGAVLPGTTVQVTNVEGGVTKTAVSDSSGGFLFSDLVPGVYDVAFDLQG